MIDPFPKRVQHWAPRFYLKNFANQNGAIFVYDITNGRVRRSGAGKIASHDYFYDDPHELLLYIFDNPQELENTLGEFEKLFSSVLGEVLAEAQVHAGTTPRSGARIITRHLKELLAWFIAMQEVRGKTSREVIVNLRRRRSKIDPQTTFYDDMGAVYQGEVLFSERVVPNFVDRLQRHYWRLGRNTSGIPFYTSDNPVAMHGYTSETFASFEEYLGLWTLRCLPLTPEYILLINDQKAFPELRKRDGRVVLIDAENARAYNALQVQHCYREVYSSTRDFTLADKLCRGYPALRSVDTVAPE